MSLLKRAFCLSKIKRTAFAVLFLCLFYFSYLPHIIKQKRMEAKMEEKFMVEEDVMGGATPLEFGGDYTLPDYMPEVRRLLRVDTRATISGTYPNGDKTEVGGDCHYDMLYTDEEGHIVSAPLDGTFECVLPVHDIEDGQILLHTENILCRPAGPRRVSMKANLTLKPQVVRREEVLDVASQTEGEEVELLRRSMVSADTTLFSKGEIPIGDKVKVEPGSTMLSADGRVLVREVKCKENELEVRGDIWVSCLLATREHIPYHITVKIPYTETIDKDDITPSYKGIAWGRVKNIVTSFTQEENSDILSLDILMDLRGMAFENKILTPVVDLYALQCPEKMKTEPISCRWYPGVAMGNFTVDGALSCDAMGITPGEHPVDVRAEVTTAQGVVHGREVCVEGEVKLYPIFTCENSYVASTGIIPYKVRLQMPELVPDGSSLNIFAECVGCHARMDGSRMVVDMELYVTAIASKIETCQVVTEVTFERECPYMDETGEIIAVYLEGRESLWNVGKRYHACLRDLQNGNGLPEEILTQPEDAQLLDGLARLLIEK
jgi:hypothetical protein